MLGLKLPTDPRWVNIVSKNLEEILTDHAFCEQKAASHAISTIVRFPYHPELVDELTSIALEEMEHFKMVHELIKSRGYQLGFERKDPYVQDLATFIKKGGSREHQLAEALLFSALIEARSCERFKILSTELMEEDLRVFYRDLMISEAQHYTTFINLARKFCPNVNVDKRWNEFLEHEAQLMLKYGTKETIHG